MSVKIPPKVLKTIKLAEISLKDFTDKAKNEILDFNNNLTFDEFNELLIKYAKSNPYPNIDN